MANIKATVDYPINDGVEVIFRSPLDYSNITGLTVCYPGMNGEMTSHNFTFVDAHCNDVTDMGELFKTGALVKVMVDLTNSYAFILNADTNGYIENKFSNIKIPTKLSDLSDDSTHRTVTDTERNTWNAKSNFSGDYNDLSNKPTIPDAVTVDSSLSSTSTNPVQNKVVNTALNNKVPTTRKVNGKALSADITLSASDIGAAESSHNHAASMITAGTFAGQVVAGDSYQTPETSLIRNSRLVSSDTTPTVNGEINWTYK